MAQTVNSAAYPQMRNEVMLALAALSDLEYQQRVWVHRDYPTATYFDNLTENIHTLYDDCTVLPDPESQIGRELVAGGEIERLKTLDLHLGPLLDDLGDAPDARYLSDARWPEVLRSASSALVAMVIASGY